jgi:chemotaxis protein methyltransferase CheR
VETPTARPLPRPASSPIPAVQEVDKEGYEQLTRDVRALLAFDLAQYKAPQVWRRVNGFASARGFADVPALLAACRADPNLRAAFRDMITINVSEFFRNPETFEALTTRYLPALVRQAGVLRIWSAGCSLGYEPYSIAMLVREASAAGHVRILATDIDETILAKAKASRYSEAQMSGVSAARRARFFRGDGDAWEVRPEIRALVTFRQHDLLRDPYETGFDLITCRNVAIYFTEEAKSGLYERFARSLRPGGVLFVGATEAISTARSFGLEPDQPGFYRRPQ